MSHDDERPDDDIDWGDGRPPSGAARLVYPVLAHLGAFAWIGGLAVVARLAEVRGGAREGRERCHVLRERLRAH